MRKGFTILLMLALLAGILYVWHTNGQAFALKPLAPAVNVSAHIINQADVITGSPTVSASFINQVLAYYRSPARGLGAALYNLGVQYGINPVYALAVFMHESAFGTLGVARSTRSLGNIRCSAGYQCIDGYRAYSSWASGFQDWYRLIRNLYVNQWHLSTVEQIIPTYAPAGDHNNPTGYVTAVEQAVSSWESGKVEGS